MCTVVYYFLPSKLPYAESSPFPRRSVPFAALSRSRPSLAPSSRPRMSNVVNKTKRSREEQPTAIEEEPSFALQPPSAEEAPLSKKAQRQAKKLAEAAQENGAGQEVTEGEGAEVAGEDDTPALSHKEKRMAKRRKLAGIPERAPAPVLPSSVPTIGSQRAPGGHEGGIAVGATPAKGAHGIWIGNMNFATTSKELLAWFEERGLREITRINMPKGKRSHENNRGCVLAVPVQLLPR